MRYPNHAYASKTRCSAEWRQTNLVRNLAGSNERTGDCILKEIEHGLTQLAGLCSPPLAFIIGPPLLERYCSMGVTNPAAICWTFSRRNPAANAGDSACGQVQHLVSGVIRESVSAAMLCKLAAL